MVKTVKIKNSGYWVSIGGFKNFIFDDVDALLERIEKKTCKSLFQLFDAEKVAGWKHLYFSAINAVNAFQSESAISKSLPIEILLFASCQNQISSAFKIIGLSPSTEKLALLVLSENPRESEKAFIRASKILGNADDSVLKISRKKFELIKKVFSISNKELIQHNISKEDALTNILIEKGAIVHLRR